MVKNVSASVRARLRNEAERGGRPFQEVLQYYALERFLYRLSRSEHRDSFVLKGALLLRVWGAPQSRPTRDIDLLGYVDNQLETLQSIIADVCNEPVDDDGLRFDAASIVARRIKEDADYEGVRLRFAGYLERARAPMQIDIGFGDVVNPQIEERTYPTILDLPPPSLRTYPRETLVAEKLQAIVFLGSLNSRMKDFYDLWLLAERFDFEGRELAEAIRLTFENRQTPIDADPAGLRREFTAAASSQRQWAAFGRRSRLESCPDVLDELREPLRGFLLPVCRALQDGRAFTHVWSAPGPWRDAS